VIIVVDIRPAPALGGTWTLPGWTLQGRWNPNEAERRASWDLLVELVTRVSVVPLGENQGLLREALGSLNALFDATRATLVRHGPELAVARRGELSFAVISAHLLNAVLRPVLVEWHPRLLAHEAASQPGGPPTPASERAWDGYDDLRTLLRSLQAVVVQYARVFAVACDAEEFVRFLVDSVDHPGQTD
jgi:hypothetical protein